MAGACVMVVGMDIATTTRSDLEDCGRLVRFFDSTDFNTMSPHDELRLAGTQYVLARPGDSYVAYASQLRGKMGLKDIAPGVYKIRWFDCATGKEIVQEEIGIAGADQSWGSPSSVGTELAVYIKRVKE